MKKYKKLKESEIKSFTCNHEGVIKIIKGHSARSAEVKQGDIFYVDDNYNKAGGEDKYRYYGFLVLKNKANAFLHDAQLSGKEIDPKEYVQHKNTVIAIQKSKGTNHEDDFWTTWSEN